jgi:hypothetical protein
MLAIRGTDAKILDGRLPGFLKFGRWCPIFVGPQCATCLTSHLWCLQFLRWQLPERLFTAGVSASHCISNHSSDSFTPRHSIGHALYLYLRTMEAVLCCVCLEGHTASNCQCFLGCVGSFSVPLTSVNRLSEFAVRKYFLLKLRSRISPYFILLFFHKS